MRQTSNAEKVPRFWTEEANDITAVDGGTVGVIKDFGAAAAGGGGWDSVAGGGAGGDGGGDDEATACVLGSSLVLGGFSGSVLALSWANASQNALWVIKLSLLYIISK